MGLFKKEAPRLPTDGPDLPELPKLPDFPSMSSMPYAREDYSEEALPRLPSFPSNAFGNKFSQNAIKDAIFGEEESDDAQFLEDENKIDNRMRMREVRGLNKFAEEDFPNVSPMRHEPFTQSDYQIPKEFQSAARVVSKSQPVFVKLDKFEASLHTFNESKHKILEVEKALHDIRKIREQEEKELQEWEHEIQTVKEQMERIERDLFSKL